METPDKRDLRPILIGGGIALVAGLAIAVVLTNRTADTGKAPPASKGGLVVEVGRDDDARLDPARPLRCYVAGQFVGEVTLAECAKRNGVATGSLDVGLDESGALVAADQAGELLTPLPPPQTAPRQVEVAPAAPPQPTVGPTARCWRYAGGWRQLAQPMTLNACVQELFAGRCVRQGDADYGRWGEQTIRLTVGRVEISGDNRSFRTLAEQGPGCITPPIG